MLKTGRKCRRNEIKVNEVFAWWWRGRLAILCRINKTEFIELTVNDWDVFYSDKIWNWESLKQEMKFHPKDCFHKLPKSTQRLWKEE